MWSHLDHLDTNIEDLCVADAVVKCKFPVAGGIVVVVHQVYSGTMAMVCLNFWVYKIITSFLELNYYL